MRPDILIQLAILNAETSQTQIAHKLGCSVQGVNNVILGKSRSERIERHLAALVGMPVETLFPDGRRVAA